MHRHISLGLAMSASALFGAVAVSGLKAQNKAPEAYAVVDISEMIDANLFRTQLLPKVTPAGLAAFGGKSSFERKPSPHLTEHRPRGLS
jgi:hypothetical protein